MKLNRSSFLVLGALNLFAVTSICGSKLPQRISKAVESAKSRLFNLVEDYEIECLLEVEFSPGGSDGMFQVVGIGRRSEARKNSKSVAVTDQIREMVSVKPESVARLFYRETEIGNALEFEFPFYVPFPSLGIIPAMAAETERGHRAPKSGFSVLTSEKEGRQKVKYTTEPLLNKLPIMQYWNGLKDFSRHFDQNDVVSILTTLASYYSS